jgi:hypothetical protein
MQALDFKKAPASAYANLPLPIKAMLIRVSKF